MTTPKVGVGRYKTVRNQLGEKRLSSQHKKGINKGVG
jgi:hypothetical protein